MCLLNPTSFCGHDQTRFIDESGDSHRNTVPCGGCRTTIVGPRFRCTLCNFSLHPLCKTRPPSLSTFLHPQHPLTLVTAAATAPPSRRCDVCFEPIGGVYYTCCKRRCDFDVHPQCSQISQSVRHVLDSHHALVLQHRAPYSTRCNVCRGDCAGWAYRCGVCHVDVHYWCLWRPAVVAAPPATATRQPRRSFYFGQSSYPGYGGGNNSVPYWWPAGNYGSSHHNAVGGGSGSGSGLGVGSGMGVMNITGSLAVNLLSSLTSNLIQNGFLFN